MKNLTEKEKKIGIQLVKCEHGNDHKIQCISKIIEPYLCNDICLKDNINEN